MATFSVSVLGCKVSLTDTQEVRERLFRDVHVVADTDADVATVDSRRATQEAVRKSRHVASRLPRSCRRYSPWLVDRPVGEPVRMQAGALLEEGILAA